MKLEVGKEYNLNNVKEIKTTKDFLTLDKYVIGCQNVESINECRSREYVDTLLKMCGCLPFGLIDLDQVTKHFEIPNIFDIHVILFYYSGTLPQPGTKRMHQKYFCGLLSLFTKMWRNWCNKLQWN